MYSVITLFGFRFIWFQYKRIEIVMSLSDASILVPSISRPLRLIPTKMLLRLKIAWLVYRRFSNNLFEILKTRSRRKCFHFRRFPLSNYYHRTFRYQYFSTFVFCGNNMKGTMSHTKLVNEVENDFKPNWCDGSTFVIQNLFFKC